MNQKTHSCDLCPEGCFLCYSDSQSCDQCKEGYYKKRNSKDCIKIPIPNCKLMNQDVHRCDMCETGFLVNPLNPAECFSCNAGTNKFCTSCIISGSPTNTEELKQALTCTGCPSGFASPDSTQASKCETCPEGCSYCESKDKCYQCYIGFVLDPATNKCTKEEDPQCFYSTAAGCQMCSPGFYLDTQKKKCSPCDSSCYACRSSGTDTCYMCPVNRAFLELKPVTPDGGYVPSNLTCLEKCEPKDAKGNNFELDEFTRECRQMNQDDQRNKTSYPFTRTTIDVSARTILQDSFTFVEQLQKYTQEITRKAKEWADKDPETAKLFPLECTHRGTLLEKIIPYRETYYACRCDKGYFGPACNLDKELHTQAQNYIQDMVFQMPSYCSSATVLDLIDAISILNLTPSITPENLQHIINLIVFQIGPRSLPEIVEPFNKMIDLVIRSMYRQISEQENSRSSDITDISNTFSSQFPKMVNDLSVALQKLTVRAFPSKLNSTKSATKAFQVSTGQGNSSFFATSLIPIPPMPGRIYPSDIHGLSQETRPVEYVWMVTDKWNVPSDKTSVAGFLYSSLLFRGGILDQTGFLASHVIKPVVAQIVNGLVFSVSEESAAGTKLLVRFPLRVLPSDSDGKEKLTCIAIRGVVEEGKFHWIYEKNPILGLETDKATKKYSALCQFDSKYVMMTKDSVTGEYGGGFYYTVGWQGLTDDQNLPAQIRRVAMDENDDTSEKMSDLNNTLFDIPLTSYATILKTGILISILFFN